LDIWKVQDIPIQIALQNLDHASCGCIFCRTPSEDRESNDDDCVLIEKPEIDGKYMLESSYKL